MSSPPLPPSGTPRIKDGGKLGKAKVKKMKKTIPPWASISANKKMAAAVSGFARATPKVDEVLLEAVKVPLLVKHCVVTKV